MATIESFENESSEYAPKWLAGELQGLYQVGVIAVQQKNFSHMLIALNISHALHMSFVSVSNIFCVVELPVCSLLFSSFHVHA
jgi:hypothetical protein